MIARAHQGSRLHTPLRKGEAKGLRAVIWAALLVFVLVGTVSAELADKQQMDNVAVNWVLSHTASFGQWAEATDPQITGMDPLYHNDTLVGHCYHIAPAGYVVVPVLMELPPVKLYSDVSNLDVNAADGMALMVREVLLHRMQYYIDRFGSLDAVQTDKSDIAYDPANRAEWDRFAVDPEDFAQQLQSGQKADIQQVGPLLTQSWHQGYPYNLLAPYGDGGRCVVGCVATAAAQIMAYHKWPIQGNGTVSYYWSGDYSCGGSTPGQQLSADLTNPYDWDNMPDDCHDGCTSAERDAVAELCYEVGVAFQMNYGRCGSGAYTSYAQTVFPEYFGYSDSLIDRTNRSNTSAAAYFQLIQDEINNLRPMQYRIYSHSIVCDGWRLQGETKQMHLNYGWDSGHNAWYTMDNLHCPWDGCSPWEEYIIHGIMPFNAASFSCDKAVGQVPLEVAFQGGSDLMVDQWIWDFGDGDSAWTQSPVHTYSEPGVYTVVLEVHAGSDVYASTRQDYIAALADTMVAMEIEGGPGDTVEVVVYGRNVCPLDDIRIPVQVSGDLVLTMLGYTTQDCRTSYFDLQDYVHWDAFFNRYTARLQVDAQPDLGAGDGPLARLLFAISTAAEPGQSAQVSIGGYGDYQPRFSGPVASYNPYVISGTVNMAGCCIGIRGNVDNDPNNLVNVSDVTALIAFLFDDGPMPECPEEADVSADGNINVQDLTFLISYLFDDGPPPPSCY
jgi:PKD repeat protein